MQEDFNEYMNSYKELPLKEKQRTIMDQLKMIATFTNKMCQDIGANNEIILNKDVAYLNKPNYTEDDFAEAVIVLVNSIQNSICDFDLKLADIIDEM